GAGWNIQAPPNLSYAEFPRLLDAGINDWGGVSPVTVDHVNPEAPWPELERLAEGTRSRGLELAPRLTVYPDYVVESDRWLHAPVTPHVLALADGEGLAREDEWAAGAPEGSKLDPLPRAAASFKATPTLLPAASLLGKNAQVGNGSVPEASRSISPPVAEALAKVREEGELAEDDITELFRARGASVPVNPAAARRGAGEGARRGRARRRRHHGALPGPWPRLRRRRRSRRRPAPRGRRQRPYLRGHGHHPRPPR